MPSLDTNVLLRYVVRDDPAQTRRAAEFIGRFENVESSLFIPLSVTLETEWVLRSVYEFAKDSVLEVFVGLLGAREIRFQDEACVETATYLYRDHNADFADCLHVATAFIYDQLPLVTFDRLAGRIDGVAVV